MKARPLKSSKKQKKTDEADIDLGGAETLIVTQLAKNNVGALEFFTQFDNLVRPLPRTLATCTSYCSSLAHALLNNWVLWPGRRCS